ncbi:hypothetical protein DPMN_142475 [Dreissena polymorpha]|uniref:Uncharacterized protein n=1 Tax=Dreissena polymorpha TaxID=45954 RepID=A0A9D4GBD0_DREPO|nr:hypothetical protein DPMN_142475 [Dreissena polymorpha]
MEGRHRDTHRAKVVSEPGNRPGRKQATAQKHCRIYIYRKTRSGQYKTTTLEHNR